jgi:hypothetical protein
MPERQRRRLPERLRIDTYTNTILEPDQVLKICRVASMPLIPGRLMSIRSRRPHWSTFNGFQPIDCTLMI